MNIPKLPKVVVAPTDVLVSAAIKGLQGIYRSG
jgi:hypothetical protein